MINKAALKSNSKQPCIFMQYRIASMGERGVKFNVSVGQGAFYYPAKAATIG
ncbi:hypothetical protein D3C87_640180 [compost metagenome]